MLRSCYARLHRLLRVQSAMPLLLEDSSGCVTSRALLVRTESVYEVGRITDTRRHKIDRD